MTAVSAVFRFAMAGRFTNAVNTIICVEFDKHPVFPRIPNDKGLNVCYFHNYGEL